MLKKVAAIVIALVSLSVAVSAQTDSSQQKAVAEPQTASSPQKQALVAELLRVTGNRKQTQQILDLTLAEFEKVMPDLVWSGLTPSELAKLSPQEQEELKNKITQMSIDTSRRFRERLTRRLNFEKLEEITGELYAKFFTEAELADLIQFYKSSTGQRALEITPQLLAESMSQSQKLMMPIIEELSREISEEQTAKIKKDVEAIIESPHREKKTRNNPKRRP